MLETSKYIVQLDVAGEDIFPRITSSVTELESSAKSAFFNIETALQKMLTLEVVADGLTRLNQGLQDLTSSGISLDASLTELSAITGVTGDGLTEIEKAARSTAKVFGTNAAENVEAYKLVLSQLDPEIAKNSEAMQLMGENINVLSKQLGGDTVTATNVLTTSMNQFGISTENPIQAAKVMAEMMNTMSAAAQAGSAELPQIQSALEQVGMVAKTTGLSFEETNAQIQILDKAGKKGSEGGIALRNVLTTLSQGRFTSNDAKEGLASVGISVEYLADVSVPLTDRLRTLQAVQNDTALMSKIFGKENVAAAIAMINGADAADELTTQITGTNSAVEQADIIMSSYSEKMKRNAAWWDDLKIRVFKFSRSLMPTIQNVTAAVSAMGQMALSGQALISVWQSLNIRVRINNIKTWLNTKLINKNTRAKLKATSISKIFTESLFFMNAQFLIGSVLAKIQASGLRSVARAFGEATLGATAFNIALDAIGIGLILAAIAGLIAGLKYLWTHSKRFREELYGVGYAARAVFHNIGVVAKRVWNLVLKPVGKLYIQFYTKIFKKLFELAKWISKRIVNIFKWLYSSIYKPFINLVNKIKGRLVSTVKWLRDLAVGLYRRVVSVVSRVYNIINNVLGGLLTRFQVFFLSVYEWVHKTFIAPVREAFGGLWEWITKLLDNIMNRLSGLLKPIRDLWNKLFSGEGMTDVKVAYAEGRKAGGESFDKDNAKEELQKNDLFGFDAFDTTTNAPSTQTFGGAVANRVLSTGGGGGSGVGAGATTNLKNLTIGKVIETLNINTTAGKNGIDKNQLYNAVREVMVRIMADTSASY